MTGTLERDVAAHYGLQDLTAKVLDALRVSGADPERLTVASLGPVDEFHIGGRSATDHAISMMSLTKNQHVLDVGCGIGGAARVLASTVGCRVTGIDLTPAYIETARELTRRTGLAHVIDYKVASALDMPFPDAAFDAALTFHVAMNIKDRAGLYAEVARVLKPGAEFCIYDVMKGDSDGLTFPVPWAETPQTSHLVTPAEMVSLLEAAGFTVAQTHDRREIGIAFFRERLAPTGATPSPVGLHLLMSNARTKLEHMLTGLEKNQILPVVMLARRR